MAKAKSKLKSKQTKTLIILSVVLGVLLTILGIQLFLNDRILPFVRIDNLDVSLLTKYDARERVANLVNSRIRTLDFDYKDQKLKVALNVASNSSDLVERSVEQAFSIGRSRFYPIRTYLPQTADINTDIGLSSETDQDIEKIASAITEPAIEAQIKIDGESINVTPSSEGFGLDKDQFRLNLKDYLNGTKGTPYTLPTKVILPTLTYQNALNMKQVLDQIKLKPIQLKAYDQNFSLDLPTVLELIDNQVQNPVETVNNTGRNLNAVHLTLNPERTGAYLKTIADKINRPLKEPLFNFDQTANGGKGRVLEFAPPQEGVSLNISKSLVVLNQALISPQPEVSLSLEITPTHNKLANDLGVKELIGEGYSRYEGSIPNRVFNVALTAKRINGTIIPPGETFSFVQTVGEITGATGYKPAYVIKSGRTVLDDGGGVCQVSTTLFRAALNSGLPIVQRTAHAYRVHYYEEGSPPGIDATIFSPSVDFKFKNDTPKTILVQAFVTDNLELYVNLYGTSDGRVATVSTPVISSVTPAPPDLRQDDPTLPKGEVKQVDFAAAGANISFKRKVTRDGQTLIDETWHSNYRPWQAIYLVGTKE